MAGILARMPGAGFKLIEPIWASGFAWAAAAARWASESLVWCW